MSDTVNSKILRALLEQVTVNAISMRMIAALADKADPNAEDEDLKKLAQEMLQSNGTFLEAIETAIKNFDRE